MKMKTVHNTKILSFAILATASTQLVVAATKLSAEKISADIRARGAHDVAAHLFNEQGAYDRVMARVRTGAPEWVRVGVQLAPGTDAATAEDLSTAMALALAKNPRLVLSALDSHVFPISPQSVCNPPFIDETPGQILKWMREVKTALATVRAASLQDKKSECLHEITNLEKSHAR